MGLGAGSSGVTVSVSCVMSARLLGCIVVTVLRLVLMLLHGFSTNFSSSGSRGARHAFHERQVDFNEPRLLLSPDKAICARQVVVT